MPNFICTTCGTQHAESEQPPNACAICQDDRQYVKKTGQQWTTLDRLRLTNRNSIKFKEPGLIGIGIEPQFAIGQRALFVRTPNGNVLWDCLPLLDEAVVEMVKASCLWLWHAMVSSSQNHMTMTARVQQPCSDCTTTATPEPLASSCTSSSPVSDQIELRPAEQSPPDELPKLARAAIM
jgi:hypothetical protein